MAPPSSCRPATSRRGLSSVDQLGEPLARLSINPRPKLHSDRVSKPTSSNPAKHSAAHYSRWHDELERLGRQWTLWARGINPELGYLNLHELDCAQAIFNKLPTMPHIATRTPRLLHRENNQYELEYPKYGLLKLANYLESPGLTSEATLSLWSTLLEDIHLLYDAHIAYTPDIKTLIVTRKSSGRIVPIISTFDFSRHVDDQAVPWHDLKEKAVHSIQHQFEVLVRLTCPSDCCPSCVALQPDSTVEVLESIRATSEDQSTICHVGRYSPKLGDYVGKVTSWRIPQLHTRIGPAPEHINVEVRSRLLTVSHTLELLDQYCQGGQIEHHDLKQRALLWMLYAALLIHLHAKNIISVRGLGLLRYNELVPDSYTSYEGFQSVANACSRVEDAMRTLEEEGDYSCSDYFLQLEDPYRESTLRRLQNPQNPQHV